MCAAAAHHRITQTTTQDADVFQGRLNTMNTDDMLVLGTFVALRVGHLFIQQC